MKKFNFLLTSLLLVVLSLNFTACSNNDDDDDDSTSLVGKWEETTFNPDEPNRVDNLTFKSDGTFQFTRTITEGENKGTYPSSHGTYKVNEGKIYFMYIDETGYDVARIKTFTTNTLSFTWLDDNGGERDTDTYKKVD